MSTKKTTDKPAVSQTDTAQHFAAFKDEFTTWQERFGLLDWEVFFSNEIDEDNRASLTLGELENRCIAVNLSRDWDCIPTEDFNESAIRLAAFHECCELLLGRLERLAQNRGSTEDHLREEVHAIIRRLEAAIWKKENQ